MTTPATKRRPASAHAWRETDRQTVELVRRVCDCGCGRQTISMVSPDGRSIGLNLPRLRGRAPSAADVAQAVSVGRQVVDLWKQFSSVFRALR